ncbi:MAG: response regulator [Ignavibacteria bacterium]|nr:response regulator [Ignavibacteria bacterium]MBT8392840.1 response regulator [Ignavibacteria bacterium]NNL20225.1 response regulator [Ignavibacteriaceae bacterium]
MALFILAVIVFIISDLLIRYIAKRVKENKLRQEREDGLKESLKLDFTSEAKTLKRAEVEKPKARILCVDDEAVILDSFRKILVLDGYFIDTVETGKEALGLVQSHSYDFVFTDLKMPEMNGVEVTKAVKHIRPDIDVVIITGYATVESAVECMKYGAMDYVQKPFTEDELLDFTKKLLIKRENRISKLIKPKVHITHLDESGSVSNTEFQIPGGVFISNEHCWTKVKEYGTVRIGIDDFAKKIIGKIDSIELPNLGMVVTNGQHLFSVKQGHRIISFKSPVSGKVGKINKFINDEIESLNNTTYEKNWVCEVEAEELDTELSSLKIGKSAVSFYQDEIEKCKEMKKKFRKGKELESGELIYCGEMEEMDDAEWISFVKEFFE